MKQEHGCFPRMAYKSHPPSQHQLVGIHMKNYFIVLKLPAQSLMTFWPNKTGGGWIIKYFPKLQNILELIPDLHVYLLTMNSFKLFWYA